MAVSSQTKETILVADDEASIRRILETRLSMIGCKVVTACDGKEALKLFKDYDPDLVVLDVMMPKLDGYGVCQELRKDSDVPIVMLTALGDVADRITGLELGADDYVVKPFSNISKIPISKVDPNLFFTLLSNLWEAILSPSKLSTTSTKCSKVFGPARAPSFVT